MLAQQRETSNRKAKTPGGAGRQGSWKLFLKTDVQQGILKTDKFYLRRDLFETESFLPINYVKDQSINNNNNNNNNNDNNNNNINIYVFIHLIKIHIKSYNGGV